MSKKTNVERARNLAVRFKRIKTAIMVTDTLVDGYFLRRAEEIEAFNAELQPMLAPEAETPPATQN